METVEPVKSRSRPAGVWVICLYYFLTAGFTLLSLVMVHQGAAALSPEQKSYLATMTAADYMMTIVSAALTLSAVVSLFLLRPVAFPLFCAALALSMAFTIWHILTRH